jgi:hypothetical protein
MPPLDFSQETLDAIAANLRHCRTLTDAERYLQDAVPKIGQPKAWGIWDGFADRPESELSRWSMSDRRDYRSGLRLGRAMR